MDSGVTTDEHASRSRTARVADDGSSAGCHTDGGEFDFADVVRQFEAPLLRYVAHLSGSVSECVQDVVQDTFLHLHRQVAAHGTGSVRHLSSWLYRVAHNLAMDAGRRRQRRRRLQECVMRDPVVNPGDTAEQTGPDHRFERREACALAVAALEALPEEQKNVLLLKIVQGFTLQEISTITGMKIGTVNYRLTQGLRALAARLEKADRL